MTPEPALVLLDIDGTLVTSDGAGRRALAAALAATYGGGATLPELDTSGKLDPQIYRELAALLPHLDLSARETPFREAYFAALEGEGARFRLLPGVREVVRTLAGAPHVALGLLTGNHARAAAIKLAAVGLALEGFEVNAFGGDADTRPALVTLARSRFRERFGRDVAPGRVVVVGDTPRDVACARAGGCVSYAVATGRWSADALREAGADVVAADLRDPAPLYALLDLRPA